MKDLIICEKCLSEIEFPHKEHQCDLRRRIRNLKEYIETLEKQLYERL